MPTLARDKRLAVLAALVDGNSARATTRMCDVNLRTVLRFGLTLGAGAINLHNAMVRDIATPLLELDEVWSYVGKKQARCTPEESAAGLGEAYNFVGLAMPSRFVVSWECGKRDGVTCGAFAADLRSRLRTMPAITSDGFAPYIGAIGKEFGFAVDYSQGVKHYTKGGRRDDDHRYEPPRDPFLTKHIVFGAPDLETSTTAHIERHNGTMRHIVGRMRRLVYAFSKDPAHHRAALALAYTYYNFCWIPRTLRVTPAMAIGLSDHIYELPELMDALLSAEPSERPTAQPLEPRQPTTTARPLPAGRGFLRVAPSSGSSRPTTTPPGHGAPPGGAAPEGDGWLEASGQQLSLLDWKPRAARPLPPVGETLPLFPES